MSSRSAKHRIRVTGAAASVIETDVIDAFDPERAYEEDESSTVIRHAWSNGALVFDASEGDALRRALCDLSNRCDELSTDPGVAPEEQKIYRRASSSLATLMFKVPR
jgi:hypothetical protein